MEKKIVVGSGKLYITVWDNVSIPDDAVIEIPENLLGNISGGASLQYSPNFKTFKDDLGLIQETILVDEECIFKSGIMNWNTTTLAKLTSTSTIEEDAVNKKRTLKLGGVANYNNTTYLLRFVHEDLKNGNLRLTLAAQNKAGFELTFKPEDATVINAEFLAKACDSEGHLVLITEDDSTIVA